MTKDGLKKPNYFGSLTHAATVRARPPSSRMLCGAAPLLLAIGTPGCPELCRPAVCWQLLAEVVLEPQFELGSSAPLPAAPCLTAPCSRAVAAAQVRVGNYRGEEIHVPFSSLLPMVHPNDFVLGGWDISGEGWQGVPRPCRPDVCPTYLAMCRL